MKRAKYRREAGPALEEMDSSKLAEKNHCTGGMTSTSTCENIRYCLRSGIIFDCKQNEKHTLENSVSVVKESGQVKTNHNAQMSKSFRNISQEDFGGKPSTKVDTFTQQRQTSKYNTDSINDRFKSEASIMMLPNEVLTMIFSYLNVHELSTSVAPVCNHWYQIAHSPILW